MSQPAGLPETYSHETPSKIPPAKSPPVSDYDEIKAVLEVLNTIFDVFTQYQLRKTIRRITKDPKKETPTYQLYVNTEARLLAGTACLPTDTPAQVQNAYKKQFLCDLAMETMLAPVSERLRTIGARVDWLIVTPHLRLQLDLSDDIPGHGVTSHSILSITSKSYELFMADFTTEQHGYPKEMWLMKREEYLTDCTQDGVYRLADDEMLERAKSDQHYQSTISKNRRLVGKMRELCRQGLDWDELGKLGSTARIEAVESRAKEVFESAVESFYWTQVPSSGDFG